MSPWALRPSLVAADVDVLGREDVQHLGQDVLQEGEGFLLAHAEDVFGDAPAGPDVIRAAGAAQLRIGGQGRDHVAGQVHLRDDGDVALRGVGHDLAHLVLGIETAVADAVARVEVLADAGAAAPGAHLGELRILLDLHAPALVLGEVPVEPVQLVGGGDVDVALGLLDGPEVAAGIQVDAAVVEARGVQDGDAGEEPGGLGFLAAVNLRGKHLLERLDGVEEAAEGRRFHVHAVLLDLEEVFLGAQVRVHAEVDHAVLAALAGLSGHGFQGLDEALDGLCGGIVHVFVPGDQGAGHVEGALGEGHVVGHRDHAERLRLLVFAAGHGEGDGQESKKCMFHIKS